MTYDTRTDAERQACDCGNAADEILALRQRAEAAEARVAELAAALAETRAALRPFAEPALNGHTTHGTVRAAAAALAKGGAG